MPTNDPPPTMAPADLMAAVTAAVPSAPLLRVLVHTPQSGLLPVQDVLVEEGCIVIRGYDPTLPISQRV